MTVYGILFTIIIRSIENVIMYFQESILMILIGVVFSALTFISVYHCFRCFIPRIEKKYPLSFIFFGDIANKFEDADDYYAKMRDVIADEDSLTHLARQHEHGIIPVR